MGDTGFATFDEATCLVERLHGGVSQVRDGAFWKLCPDDLFDLGRDVERLARLVYAVQVRLVGELDAQGVAKQAGYHSTATMIRQGFNISPGDAQGRVRAARNLLPQDQPSGGEAPPVLPLLGEAVDAGEVGPEHVRIICQTMKALPSAITSGVRGEAESFLVGESKIHDPADLDKIAQKLADTLDPDGSLDEKSPADRAELHFGSRNHATKLTPVTGKLDDLGVATVRKALDALSQPKPDPDGTPDPRPAATRAAHALTEALQIFLNSGKGPSQGGVAPHVTVLVDWDALTGAVGAAQLDTGYPVSAEVFRLLACDSEIFPVALNGWGRVMSVGRASRTFPVPVRRAIAARDRGCVMPGCDRPPAWCEYHHIVWWARDLGETSLDNGCLICRHHHTLIHQGDWQIRMGHDGRPEVIPPRWIDPDRKPRRNNMHQLL